MKRVAHERLQVDDFQILEAMCRDRRLGSYPALQQQRDAVEDAFRQYQLRRGNRLGNPNRVTNQLGAALQAHYAGEIQALSFIARIRKNLSPDVCPCCGSGSASVVDHVLPQAIWQVYSVFSWNLVPACDECNRQKGADYQGQTENERPVHPYFDEFLVNRVVRAELRPPFDAPDVRIIPLPGLDAVELETVEWHLEHVVRRTSVAATLTGRWLNACRDPMTSYPSLKYGATIEQAVADKLGQMDRDLGTPNNWESMLQAGISVNPGAMEFLDRCRDFPLPAA